MRIAVIQLAYGDDESPAARTSRVVDLVQEQRGADLVVLPELWGPGGFAYPEWAQRAEPLDGPTVTAVATAAARIGAVVHAGSIIERDGENLYNTSVVVGPGGERLAAYRKIHRFGFGSGEPRLLRAGRDLVTVDLPSGTAGLATCYDLRFPEFFRALLNRGAGMFVVPAAWPAARVEAWRLLARARAVENQAVVVACNTAGNHAGHEMGGHSAVIGPDGTLLAEAGTDQQVLTVDVDLTDVEQLRRDFPVHQDRQPAHFYSADGPR